MQSGGFFKETKMKRVLSMLMSIVMCFSMVVTGLPATAFAAGTQSSDAAATVFFYATDRDGDNVLLKTISMDTLKTMSPGDTTTGTNYYTSTFDNMPTPIYHEGRGVTIPELLDYVKTNSSVDSVASLVYEGSDKIYFSATDDFTCNFTVADLLDVDRYYYPDLFTYWDTEEGEVPSGDVAKVWSTKTPAPVYLATESYGGRVFYDDSKGIKSYVTANNNVVTGCLAGAIDSENALRLVVPQVDADTSNKTTTYSSTPKWVYMIRLKNNDSISPIHSLGTVATPTCAFSLDGTTLTITMSCATDGAAIYQSIDGTTATGTAQHLYTAPIVIENYDAASPIKVRYRAVKEGYADAGVQSASSASAENPTDPGFTYALTASTTNVTVGSDFTVSAALTATKDYTLYDAEYQVKVPAAYFTVGTVSPNSGWQAGTATVGEDTLVTFTYHDTNGAAQTANTAAAIGTIGLTPLQEGSASLAAGAAVVAKADGTAYSTVDSPALAVNVVAAPPAGSYWDGSVDTSWYEANPSAAEFHLYDAADLAGLAYIVNQGTEYPSGHEQFKDKTIYLENDIYLNDHTSSAQDATARAWPSIGGSERLHNYKAIFNGTFDGKGHTVYNMYIYQPENYTHDISCGRALFGGAAENAVIRNVSVTGYVECARYAAGIVGKVSPSDGSSAMYPTSPPGALIENCTSYCTIVANGRRGSAGIVGCAWNYAMVRNCANYGTITQTGVDGYGNVGGIVGETEYLVENCVNYGSIINNSNPGEQGNAGGIAAQATSTAIVHNCYNVGTVSSSITAGGIIGNEMGASYNCYNLGAVTGAATGATVGGVIGRLATSNNNSNLYYYTGTAAAGIGNPGSYTDNTTLLTDSMKETFLTAINNNGMGRSFVADLPGENAINNGWPVLRFQTGTDTTTVTSLSIAAPPAKTAYIETQTFNPAGMVVIANYSDGTSEPVLLYSYPKEALAGGTTSVTIGYEGATVDVPITVAHLKLTSLVISTAPSNTYYVAGDSFDKTGMVVTAYFNNTTGSDSSANRVSQVLAAADYTVTPEVLSAGDTFVTVSYTHHGHDGDVTKTVEQAVTVIGAAPGQAEDGCYLIQTANDLQWFANQVSVLGNAGINARLAGNIDLTGVAWTPIGSSANPFKGTFDGNNKAITGLDNNNAAVTTQYYGLIGYADGATVKDLSVTANLTGSANHTSALVAYAKGGSTLTNLTANGTITKTSGSYNGGIAGALTDTTISGCVNNTVISGNGSQSGGIVGSMGPGCTIADCTNNGELNMTSNWTGGISGYNGTAAEATASIIKNCTNNAKITGGSFCGGIAGQNFAYQYIENCANLADVICTNTYAGGIAGRVSAVTSYVKTSYNTGRISCKQSTGGIVGNNSGVIMDCYNLGNVDDYTSGGTASHGIGGIAGTSATSAITNAYNAGAVTRTNEAVYIGGVVGLLSSGSTVNSYYLAGTATAGVGSGTDATAVKTSDELKALAPVLGESFKAGSAYPILVWQGATAPETYTVTVDGSISGGTVAVSPASAAAGETVTVTVTPEAGKRLVAGSLKYSDGAGDIEITSTEGVYSFVMPAADVTVTAQFEDLSPAPKYTVTPLEDESVYEVGETDGIKTMTVKTGVTGLKYFGTQITPVVEHEGQEAVVFTHLRDGVQLSLNVTKADFDLVDEAQAGFNVQAGDVVKAYIVDELTNDLDFNPTLLQ